MPRHLILLMVVTQILLINCSSIIIDKLHKLFVLNKQESIFLEKNIYYKSLFVKKIIYAVNIINIIIHVFMIEFRD
jgi:hypothetical protein